MARRVRRLSRLRPRRLGLRARIRLSFVARRAAAVAAAGRRHLRASPARPSSTTASAPCSTRPTRTPSGCRTTCGRTPSNLQPHPREPRRRVRPLVLAGGRLVAAHLRVRPRQPARARCATKVIDEGNAARMLYRLDGDPVLAVGIPLASVGASYFEIVSFAEVQSTLAAWASPSRSPPPSPPRSACCSAAWPLGRAVRPLGDAAQAAKAIAGGRLDTRLEPTEDRDLRPAGHAPSTTWPPPCSSGSSATPASPPTSATSCARRSRPCRRRSRCCRPAATRCPSAPSPPSTCSWPTSPASRASSTTCSRSPASTPAPCGSTGRSCSSPSSCARPSPSAACPTRR